MNRFEVTIKKTEGGSGTDAWTAKVHIEVWGGPCSTLEVSARGETIAAAKTNAARGIQEMIANAKRAISELTGAP